MTQPGHDAVTAGVVFRNATRDDVLAVVRLLADDPLGSRRERFETPLPQCYLDAFAAIDADPNNELIVAERDGAVVGVLQLTYIPGMTYEGSARSLIEGVRIEAGSRSLGLGRALFEHAIERSRSRGCRLVQLTTDKTRPGAKRFYEALGFVASHEGMKLDLRRTA